MAFDNLLKLAAESDRETLSEMAERYPWIKDYVEAGEDLHTEHTLLEEMNVRPAAAVRELSKWRNWLNKDWKEHQANAVALQTAYDAAQAKVQELEGRMETQMTTEEVQEVVRAVLKEAGFVNGQDLETKLTDLVEKKVRPEISNTISAHSSRFSEVYADLTPEISRHYRQFGEDLDVRQVYNKMEELAKARNVPWSSITAKEAYDAYVAPRVAEKVKADNEAALKKAREEGKAEGRTEGIKEAGNMRGAQVNPADARGTVRMGNLQKRQMDKFAEREKNPGQRGSILGKGVLSRKATDEYLEKQSSAVNA